MLSGDVKKYRNVDECIQDALLNYANAELNKVDQSRENTWVNGNPEKPINPSNYILHPELRRFFEECNHQGSVPHAGNTFLIYNLRPKEIVPNFFSQEVKTEYFIFSNNQIILIESFYVFSYLKSSYNYELIDNLSTLPDVIQDNTFYASIEKDKENNNLLRYRVKSPTGKIIEDVISEAEVEAKVKAKIKTKLDLANLDLERYLFPIFEITTQREHTNRLRYITDNYYSIRGNYNLIDNLSTLPDVIQDNTFYASLEKDKENNNLLRYRVKSPTGRIIEDVISEDETALDLNENLLSIFKITAARGHTRPLLPIAKSVTISLIHLEDNISPKIQLDANEKDKNIEESVKPDVTNLLKENSSDQDANEKNTNLEESVKPDVNNLQENSSDEKLKENNQSEQSTKKLAAKLLKHARFVLDEKNNDILFSKEQNHVFKRFNSSQEEVDFEAELLILSYLLMQDKELSKQNQNYQTPEWLTKKKESLLDKIRDNTGTTDALSNFLIIMKKLEDENLEDVKTTLLNVLLDGQQDFENLKKLLFKLQFYGSNKPLQTLIQKFSLHISELEKSGYNKESLKKDLTCVVNAIINDTPQNLFKLHHRVETNLATRNKQVISATVATVATSLCVVGGLTLFAPATLPAMAAVTVAGLATAGAGAAGTKKVKDTAEEKRVTPATYEEEILNNLLQQYVDNEDYGKFVLFEWELIKSSIASRGVKNKARDDLIAHYEAKLKGFRGDVTQTTNFLVNCRDALLKQNPTSETAKEITNLITKLSNHHFLSLMKKEFDYEHYTSYMLLRLNNIMANAKLRKADTKRDKILQSLVSFIEEFDFIPSQKPDFKDDISDCVKKLRALSRNSTTAIELEQLQSELSIYAERYKAPERSCTTTTTMSCGK